MNVNVEEELKVLVNNDWKYNYSNNTPYMSVQMPTPVNFVITCGKGLEIILKGDGTITYDGMSADEATQEFLTVLSKYYPTFFNRKVS